MPSQNCGRRSCWGGTRIEFPVRSSNDLGQLSCYFLAAFLVTGLQRRRGDSESRMRPGPGGLPRSLNTNKSGKGMNNYPGEAAGQCGGAPAAVRASPENLSNHTAVVLAILALAGRVSFSRKKVVTRSIISLSGVSGRKPVSACSLSTHGTRRIMSSKPGS
jgi:hypothetical protein